MDDANFVFSLYSRDLIHVKSKKDIKTNLVNGGLLLQKEIFAYYTGADIATASIAGFANDSTKARHSHSGNLRQTPSSHPRK